MSCVLTDDDPGLRARRFKPVNVWYIPSPCFGKASLCCLSSCWPFFALSGPQPSVFLLALRALWCLPDTPDSTGN